MEVKIHEQSFAIERTHQPREDWEEAFRQMHETGDDKLLMPDVFDDETWEA